MNKIMRVLSLAAVSLPLLWSSNTVAQISAWQVLNGYVVNAYNPNTLNPLQSDTCGVVCAEGFTIGSDGAYVTGIDMGLTGANFTGSAGTGSTAITCPFTMSVITRDPDTSLGFQIVSRSATVTIPANNFSTQNPGQFVPVSFSTGFSPALWLPSNDYYLMLDNTNGCTGANSSYQATLDWNLDAPAVAGIGPGFSHMVNKAKPATWLNVNGTYAFDMVGPIILPPTGGAKLTYTRLVVAGPVIPPPGGPVQAQVGFLNAETGSLLAPLKELTIGAGQTESVDLDLTPFVTQPGQRIEVQPVIVQTPGAVTSPVQISATVQTFHKSTGFQYVNAPVPAPGGSLSGAVGAGSPQASTLSPQILAYGQTMRFDVLASGADPCIAEINFYDVNGNPLIPASSVNLAPGAGTIVDLNSTALNFAPRHFVEVQPQITVTPPSPSVAQNSVCNASVEVFDHTAGHTWSHQSTMVGVPSALPGTLGRVESSSDTASR